MVINRLYDWQTLIGALAALYAAAITAAFLWRQITQAATQEAHRLHRKRVAYRSVLPATLMAIMDYINTVIPLIVGAYPIAAEPKIGCSVISNSDLPCLDHSILDAIRNTIEADDHPGLEKTLRQISTQLQILTSRVYSAANPSETNIVLQANLDTLLFDCAILYALVERLFPYARFETERIGMHGLETKVRQALILHNIDWKRPEVLERLSDQVMDFERRRS